MDPHPQSPKNFLNADKGGVWSRGCGAFDGLGGFDGFGGSLGFLPAAITADIGPPAQ